MIVDDIRTLRNAEPFQSFTVRTKGGKRYAVPHPTFIAIAPWNGSVAVATRLGAEIIRANEIDGVEMGADDTLYRKWQRRLEAS